MTANYAPTKSKPSFIRASKPTRIELTEKTLRELSELGELVDALRRSCIRLRNVNGDLITLNILQHVQPIPDGFRLLFPAGLIDADTVDRQLEGLELLRFIQARAF
jgi:hypothetical protein